eukprot:9503049-Pyramimonas_sp.AAC.1
MSSEARGKVVDALLRQSAEVNECRHCQDALPSPKCPHRLAERCIRKAIGGTGLPLRITPWIRTAGGH